MERFGTTACRLLSLCGSGLAEARCIRAASWSHFFNCGLLTGRRARFTPAVVPARTVSSPVARSPYALRWAASGPLSGSVAVGAPVGVGGALCVVRPQRHRRASQGRPLGRSSLFFISAVIANDLPEIMVSPHLLRFVLWSEWKADVFLPSRHQHTALGLSV